MVRGIGVCNDQILKDLVQGSRCRILQLHRNLNQTDHIHIVPEPGHPFSQRLYSTMVNLLPLEERRMQDSHAVSISA